jgi:hypothetical protein
MVVLCIRSLHLKKVNVYEVYRLDGNLEAINRLLDG